MNKEDAKEIYERNLTWIKEHLDKDNPMSLLGELHNVPQDVPAQVLRLLRRHGFKRVKLCVWVAATNFLTKWTEKFATGMIGELMKATRDLKREG